MIIHGKRVEWGSREDFFGGCNTGGKRARNNG